MLPVSPHGVTKLAAENMCDTFWHNLGFAAVSVRYFTVHGPRQRPGMAIQGFIRSLFAGESITVYGDGDRRRDFTFGSDGVAGTALAAIPGAPGEAYNLSGGANASINSVMATLERLSSGRASAAHVPAQPGDVAVARADGAEAPRSLGYSPEIDIELGLSRQLAAHS